MGFHGIRGLRLQGALGPAAEGRRRPHQAHPDAVYRVPAPARRRPSLARLPARRRVRGVLRMGVRITRVLTIQERHDMNDAAVAVGMYRDDRLVFLPGMAWYQHFYFDPTGEWEAWRAAQPDPEKYCRQPMIKRP